MNAIIYSSEILEIEKRLIKSLLKSKFNVYKSSSIQELLINIRTLGALNCICLIVLNTQNDKKTLVGISHIFWSIHTIVFTKEDDDKTISLAHEFHPCFIQSISESIDNTIKICKKIMDNRRVYVK